MCMRWTGLAAVLAALILTSPVFAQPSLAQEPPLLRSCVLEQPVIAPWFKPTATMDKADDEEEDEEDTDADDEEDDEFDEEAVRGYLAPDGVTCFGLGGSLFAGLQGDWLKSGGRKLQSWRNQDVLSLPGAAIFRFDTLHLPDNGSALGAGVTLAFRSGSGPTIDRAVLKLGGFTGGYDSSRFNFWDGSDFSFAARVPARQSNQFAYELGLSETSRVGLGVEFPVPVQTTPLPSTSLSPGLRFPDVVARFLHEGETTQVQIAAAAREIRQTFSGPPRIGRAAMIGLTQSFAVGGLTHSLTLQGAVMLGAPVYIGSQLDGRLARPLLTGQEMSNGFSAVAALSTTWSEHWTTSAYISRYDLRLPSRESAGRIEINQAAVNLVWTHWPTVRAGAELGFSRAAIYLPNRMIGFAPSGTHLTGQVFVERKF